MSRRTRMLVFVPAVLGLAALLGWGVAGIPSFGHYQGPYGFVLNRVAVPERHTTNVVAATTFDYRGFDTLGEELMLFAAVASVVLLLRPPARRGAAGRSSSSGSDLLRVVGVLAVGPTVLVGLWLVAFGYITPGGGFQGGVAIASALLLLYLASTYRAYRPFGAETFLDPFEALGAGAYIVIGLAALVSGLAFLTNLLGPGTVGTLVSGGSIAFLNIGVGLEVSAAMLVLFSEFLEEYVVPLGPGRA